MSHVAILDCTLRDGAYLIDKKFGDNNIRGIIEGLVKARIDCIEIGFFQDEGFGIGKTVFKNSQDAKRYVPKDKNGSIFTVLADCSRYSVENLDECTEDSIDAVRECFFKDERVEALEKCKVIKEKGYKCFVQPVDVLGYTDVELIELLQMVNEVEPYCFSIVDTFGSMYMDDLRRIFEIINHNLISTCKIGFHSHNNMQMSNALSQEFVRMSYGKREVIVDGTISGMGRGAGNTPTELIVQYMINKQGCNYDMDALLDIINDYMDNIKSMCKWGYSTPYFVAGSYSAHVNNIAYLTQKNSIRYKDIRYIINKIGVAQRKRYDYDLLEKTYLEYVMSEIDDGDALEKLKNEFGGKDILILVPGSSISTCEDHIAKFIKERNPIVISVNFLYKNIMTDWIYISNSRRYSVLKSDDSFKKQNKIIVSNIKRENDGNELVVSFKRLIKCGWEHLDNSTLMLLRLLDEFNLSSISIAGFDGYSSESKRNYATDELELSNVRENPLMLNEEIVNMLMDYKKTRTHNVPIEFITMSRFSRVFDND